jgi:intracellular sulfur oxidation DsrE/DsrF family protein
MTTSRIPAYTSVLLLLTSGWLLILAANCSAGERAGLVMQVSDGNPKVWNLALNIAENASKNVNHPLDIMIVAFGPGLKMLTMESPVANRLGKATASGVEFRACGMTMKKLNMNDQDLYPDGRIKRVDGGVIEIIRLQKAGWSYIKP